ncbi:MAG: hypothetical protein R3B48_14420 [Kofleriaceae bacterium]
MRLPMLLLGVLAGCGSVSDPKPDASGSARALADRPDDISGNQVHIIYAIPSDGADRKLDIDGTLQRSVQAWSSWFASKALGPKLRLDVAGGAPDITFVRLPRTDTAYAAEGVLIRDRIEQDLGNLKHINLAKAYLVYYDGTSNSCGSGPLPPALIGRAAVIYLDGQVPNAVPCKNNPIGASADVPGYFEFVAVHELMHVLGAAASCSPNQVGGGHVGDDPTDLMYAGTQPWQPAKLDAGNNDYWRHSNAGCLDLANSAFLDPLPASAQLPPGW